MEGCWKTEFIKIIQNPMKILHSCVFLFLFWLWKKYLPIDIMNECWIQIGISIFFLSYNKFVHLFLIPKWAQFGKKVCCCEIEIELKFNAMLILKRWKIESRIKTPLPKSHSLNLTLTLILFFFFLHSLVFSRIFFVYLFFAAMWFLIGNF